MQQEHQGLKRVYAIERRVRFGLFKVHQLSSLGPVMQQQQHQGVDTSASRWKLWNAIDGIDAFHT
jgi:hypothetical protein